MTFDDTEELINWVDYEFPKADYEQDNVHGTERLRINAHDCKDGCIDDIGAELEQSDFEFFAASRNFFIDIDENTG